MIFSFEWSSACRVIEKVAGVIQRALREIQLAVRVIQAGGSG